MATNEKSSCYPKWSPSQLSITTLQLAAIEMAQITQPRTSAAVSRYHQSSAKPAFWTHWLCL